MHRRTRTFLLATGTVVFLAILFTPWSTQEHASAFKLGPHEQLVRTSLAPFGIPSDRMDMIVGNLARGSGGNLGSDAHQFDNYRHFDSAATIVDVCERATDAWTRFYNEMRSAMQPSNAPEYDVIDVRRTVGILQSFGALTHSLQDFYAHSNWIELHIDGHQTPGTIDGLFPPPCDTRSWPTDLETGYFNLIYGWDGCPGTLLGNGVPPSGFMYCHEYLNKDDNEARQGRKTVPGMTITYHELAMQLAAAHTAELYQIVVSSLKRDWANDFPEVRSDCLVKHVFQGSTAPCRFGRLSVSNASSWVTLGTGTVELVSATGQALASYSISSWPPAPIQTGLCLGNLTARFDITVVDRYPLPSPRRVQGQASLSAAGCDAALQISPESRMDYLVRYTNADTVLPVYIDVIAVVNGSSLVSTGPVLSGDTIWIDLGPCTNVATYDFIIVFNEPETGIQRTATPDPPPFEALPGCQDSIRADFGGQIFGP